MVKNKIEKVIDNVTFFCYHELGDVMPELPEVETVKNALKRQVLGKKIISVDVYYNMIDKPSVEEFKRLVKNQTIIDIKRRGKFLMFELNDYYLLSHLRMEGKYFVDGDLTCHDHVVFHFDDGILKYNDTRKFGRMYLIDKNKVYDEKPLSLLGLEPWDDKLNIDYLKDKLNNKRLPVKSLLLDQSIIVGIGNIYADEILFKSKINPLKKGCELNELDFGNIIKYTREILESAIRLGGTTIKSYESSRGVHGKFQNSLLVHNHEGGKCPDCEGIVIKIKINGRGTYYCPICQKNDN